MDKTEVDDPKRLLSKLTSQERKVLELRCEGLDYKTIGKQLFLEGRTVKQYMKNIYIKLGLDHLPRTEKESKILIIYYPLIHPLEVLPETENEKIPSEPIPKNGNSMVDEDENNHAGGVKKGGKSPTPPEKPKGGSGLKLFGFLGAGVVLGICISAVIVAFILRLNPGTIPFFQRPTSVQLPTPKITETKVLTSTMEPTSTTPVTILADTVTPSPTATPTNIPTATEVPPTDTPEPSPTLGPFSDNFDNEINPAWNVETGTWVTVDGRLALASGSDESGWIDLTGYQPKNFILKVNVDQRGNVSITLRKMGARVIIYMFDVWGHNCLAFIDNNDKSCITGWAPDLAYSANVQLEVNGDTYILSQNGIETQRVTLSGQTTTSIAIGLAGGTTTFDNFSIDPLP